MGGWLRCFLSVVALTSRITDVIDHHHQNSSSLINSISELGSDEIRGCSHFNKHPNHTIKLCKNKSALLKRKRSLTTKSYDGSMFKRNRASSRESDSGATRHVYVDMGANWANTLRLWHDMGKAKPGSHWEVYAFEASPLIQPYVENLTRHLNRKGPKPVLT